MVSLPFICFFFSLKQMKRYGIIILFSFCWNNHWTDLVDSLDNSAISFYSSRTWPGFFKGRGGEEEGCHTVSNREYSPDCHVDLSWIGYSGILRRPVPLSPLFISSACQNLIAIVNYWGKISVGNEEEKCNNCSGHLKSNVSHDYKTGAQKPVSLRKVHFFQLFICFLLLHLSLNMDYDNRLFNEISINSLLRIIYQLIFLFYSFLKPTSEALRLWLCMYVEDQGCQAMNEMLRNKNSA